MMDKLHFHVYLILQFQIYLRNSWKFPAHENNTDYSIIYNKVDISIKNTLITAIVKS